MNKNDKDFMDQLSNLDDSSVEEIAENYPALYGNTKKRILKKCLKKNVFFSEIEGDGKEAITISGTERYKSRPWYRFAASAAAFVLAVGGITSVVMLNRNLNGNDIPETEKTSVLSIHGTWSDSGSNEAAATAQNSGNASGRNDPSNAADYWDTNSKEDTVTTSDNDNGIFGYWGTNNDETSQTPTTAKEPPVNNSNSSVPPTNTPEPQKSFLNGQYYVEIAGVSGYCDDITRGIHGYMGFEFMPDGTLTKYFFDETGNAIGSTIVRTNYEIVENQFSYGGKAGTIVDPNDSTSFTVQFDDGDVFNFSTKQPAFRKYYFIGTKPDTLNGTIWAKCFGDMDENYNYTDRRTIEFKEDGISGTVYVISHPRNVTKSTITEIPFTYERNGDEITFHMESSPYTMVKAEISCNPYDKEYGLDVEYLEADEWGNNLWCFGQTGCINDYNYNY